MRPSKAMLDKAVKAMQVYLGSVDRVYFHSEQRLYNKALKTVTQISEQTGMLSEDVWVQVETEARRRGIRLALPGKDI